MVTRRRIAVVGAGWSGLAAAVEITAAGHHATLFEMAHDPGGRARRIAADTEGLSGLPLDNGQHILIGAYTESLRLMRQVGIDTEAVLRRRALALQFPDGRGLALPGGPAVIAFARGVLMTSHWPWRSRLALLSAASRWFL